MLVSEFSHIPGGKFLFGSNSDYPEEGPVREVEVDDFLISQTTVTNGEFLRFVEDAGYITQAEKDLDPRMYPSVDPNMLAPGSAVFKKTKKPVSLDDTNLWWRWVPGANWRHPLGPNTSCRDDHPVVHVCYEDASAYAGWAGARLPTEIEWERAARSGAESDPYPWGRDTAPGGEERMNRWVGSFPWRWHRTALRPKSPGTVAVKTFPPTDWGLYEMCGNVWEWTSSFYTKDHSAPCCGVEKSRNPESGIPRKALRGGSFLCADNYCRRFRVSARIPQDIESATNHIGFRITKDSPA